jgi:probable rRNA maturation factor
LFEPLIRQIVKKEGRKGRINLVLVNDPEIRALNRKFRRIDRATDVLSFSMDEDGVLGDIAISTETAARNAKRYRVSLPREMKRLVVHGVLHILGYDHGEEMRNAEKVYQKL